MTSLSLPLLVPTSWLAAHLSEPGLVLLDASWYLPSSGRDPRAEYRAGHIPGAVFFDLDASSDPAAVLPHMLPTAEQFGRFAGGLGVGTDSRVVVYDGSGTNISAARVWWMLRFFGHRAVALLDGGIGRWRSEGRRLEAGDAAPVPTSFLAKRDSIRVRDKGEVRSALDFGTAQVVDMRSAGRFRGTDPEPRPNLPSGHMAGALNLPFTELVHPDGTALSEAELRVRMAAAGVRLDRPIIATCGSGTSACTLLHALERLGQPDAALYDGSWTEWAGSGMPIVREEVG
ncbi:MAG: 3-mercaptopyruvate sulfurtransferase [Gemmatimonadota bacterium]